jgi:glycosyltransferase involved in cell wall biosynthesis
MRILVLTDTYPPQATGGYERSCADVVRHWRADGHEVLVVTGAGPGHGDPGDGDGVHRVLPPVAAETGPRTGPEAADRAVTALLHGFRPEVVTAWNLARVPVAGTLAPVVRAGLPVVLVVCDGWLGDRPGWDAELPPCPPGSSVAFVSEPLARDTVLPPWAPATTVVTGSGIDADVFHARTVPARPWRHRLLSVGRLVPAKGVQDAVAALAELTAEYRLRIVGPGTPAQQQALRERATELGVADRVRLAGSMPRAALPGQYRSADAVLFPSRWQEPFGLVPLEAMACSTPVVATGTGGSGGFLRNGETALLAPVGDPAGLARAVRTLAGDPALRTALVERGRSLAAHWTVSRLADRLEALVVRAVRDSRDALAASYTPSTSVDSSVQS